MHKLVSRVLAAIACLASLSPSALADGGRRTVPLNDGWRFSFGEAASAQKPEFNDSSWQPVRVPHSWNRVGYYLNDHSASANTAATVDKRQGVAWYRLRLPENPALKGKRTWIEFDAAGRIASVWLNGTYLGEHRGGYSRFRLDVTKALRIGAPNDLAVRVDNTLPAEGSATADVLPLAGDFFIPGGLYRSARLVSTDALHFDMQDAGGVGVYARTAEITSIAARVQVVSRIRNDRMRAAHAALGIKLVNREGLAVAAATRKLSLSGSADIAQDMALDVPSPHLWAGIDDPYLYRLVAEIKDTKGVVLDRVEFPFGIRQMAVDPDRGFLLNGKPYPLHGVGYHQDRAGKGWAIDSADVERDVAIMREMGVNSIRLTHYQHGEPIYDLADRYGLILWTEIPLVSKWTMGGSLEPTGALVANAKQQLKELIRQNYNHPSVAVWGIANEVDFGNSLPAFLTGWPDGKAPDPLPLLKELRAVAKVEDPFRPTALATCCEGRLFQAGTSVPDVAPIVDLGGANIYFGWYYGAPDDLGPHLDKLHAKRPRQPVAVTEYGAGGGTTIHTDNVLGASADSRGRNQPEEYESYIHERALAAFSQRKYLFATWLWNAFDFATTIRAEGDAQDINTKGLATYDRSIRKDAWYLYKANWTRTPTVHINGSRYIERAYPRTEVRVYSNAGSTELFVNGRSLGTKSACERSICVWKDVALDGGANVVRALGHFDSAEVEDQVKWHLDPAKLSDIAIDCGALVAARGKNRSFGSDNFFSGGQAMTLDKPADYGRPAAPAVIDGGDERDALATYRTGTFSYRIPAPKGRYVLKLWFVTAPVQPSGSFNVVVNGRTVLHQFNPSERPSAVARALSKDIAVRSDGNVMIDFVPVSGEAKLSAIELKRTE